MQPHGLLRLTLHPLWRRPFLVEVAEVMATEKTIPTVEEDQPVTRAEIELAITWHNNHVSRMPKHWTDRRAGIHKIINDLLDQRDATPEG